MSPTHRNPFHVDHQHSQGHQGPKRQDFVACHYLCEGHLRSNEVQKLRSVEYHADFYSHSDPVWIFDHGRWVEGGHLLVDMDSFAQRNKDVGVTWGRFSISHPLLGEFDNGTWAWCWTSDYGSGFGTASGAGAAAGRLLVVEFCGGPPDDLPAPPARPCAPIEGVDNEVGYLLLGVS